MTREDGKLQGEDATDLVNDPGPAGKTQLSLEVSPSDEKMIQQALSSNAATTSADQDDLEEYRKERADELVDTNVSNPGTKGQLSSTEPVKGTFEGDMNPSTASTGGETYDNRSKASAHGEDCDCEKCEKKRMKSSATGEAQDNLPDFGGMKGGDKEPVDGSDEDDKKSKDDSDDSSDEEDEDSSKESSKVSKLLGLLWGDAQKKQSGSLDYADGGGTGNISSYGGAGMATARKSDNESSSMRKAIDYVENKISDDGKVPTMEDVMRNSSVNEDDAKTAIARGSMNE